MPYIEPQYLPNMTIEFTDEETCELVHLLVDYRTLLEVDDEEMDELAEKFLQKVQQAQKRVEHLRAPRAGHGKEIKN